jgi:hydroxymethylpyrimidine pyrophosphatase-like HAD family hydrolase
LVIVIDGARVQTILATGKARGPWVEKVLPALPALPGVYLQGLLIHDELGEIMFEETLEPDVVFLCIKFAKKQGLTLTAYCGDRILTEDTNEHTDRLTFYEEPTPEGAIALLVSAPPSITAFAVQAHTVLPVSGTMIEMRRRVQLLGR